MPTKIRKKKIKSHFIGSMVPCLMYILFLKHFLSAKSYFEALWQAAGGGRRGK
jgi:hypothetical protein